MLSILIPVYNFDIRNFVHDLHEQCREAGIEYEILCFDDGSEENYKILNRGLSSLSPVRYREMPANMGRAAIRNALAKEARFSFLLFADCDSKIISKNYIRLYIDQRLEKGVTCGGCCYEHAWPPADKILRWKYGMAREQVTPQKRQKQPYHSFASYNFIIDRESFLSIGFNEEIRGYGHEDTLFGLELQKRGVPVKHIHNPLCHIGLESPDTFIKKTEQGVENLLWLLDNKPDIKKIRIIRYYKATASVGLHGFLFFVFQAWKKIILKNLLSPSPSLFLFDFYKLGLMIGKKRMAVQAKK